MNQQRSIPAHQATGRRVKLLLSVAVATVALIGVGSATAGPKGPPPGAPKAGLREMFGGGRPDGKHGPGDKPGDGTRKHDHEHGPGHEVGGAPGVDGPPHGGMPPGLQKKVDELKQKEAAGTLTDDEKKELARLSQFHQRRQSREERQARLTELKQKETAGNLSDAEKQELDKVQQIQARHEEMDKRAKERAESRKQRSRDAKRQALKEAPKVATDGAATAEYKKHAERLAKLERAKELASADQNADAVTKIEGLITQETQRHQAWLAKQTAAANATSQGAKP